eukprot:TRINITY_DN31228_c0_g1_i2.p1 TRINITY_DN31228_c0_g1~~TRINITY_DN31228_c0_g1_i2.p1  ORF type:complete len:144 (-),score=7.21 TRINITY_DN31228_c0_g1_i2:26-457(-)
MRGNESQPMLTSPPRVDYVPSTSVASVKPISYVPRADVARTTVRGSSQTGQSVVLLQNSYQPGRLTEALPTATTQTTHKVYDPTKIPFDKDFAYEHQLATRVGRPLAGSEKCVCCDRVINVEPISWRFNEKDIAFLGLSLIHI